MMTAQQYYFPYFFDQFQFNDALKIFGLKTKVFFNKETKMAEKLILIQRRKFTFFAREKTLLELLSGTSLMIVGNHLIYWKTDQDEIEVQKVDLTSLQAFAETKKVTFHIKDMNLGKSEYDNDLDLKNFVSFVRKSDLKYDLDYFENFAVIIINDSNIRLLPYDSFNKLKGDYGYVWPAIAQIDTINNILVGKGMRMEEFEIDLKKDLL